MTVAFAIQTHFVDDRVIALAQDACAAASAVDLAIDADLATGDRGLLAAALPPGIVRRSRPVTWCGPSQVLALIDSIRLLLERPGWDHLVTLSGDTLRLRPLAELAPVLGRHYSDDAALILHSWRLMKPPILVERRGQAAPRLLGGVYRELFEVTPELADLFLGPDSPVRHASTRFFIGCEEAPGAKRLRLRAFDPAELAHRLATWDRITPRCARAYYVLTRAQCAALIAAIDAEQRDLVTLFLTSFEPDEAWLATLAGAIGLRVAAPAPDAVIHHAGGQRARLDAEALAAIRRSGAFFARRLRSDRTPVAQLRQALAAN